MDDFDKREALLRQDGFLIGIATLSLLNGMDFSPYSEPGLVLMKPLLFAFGITSPLLIFYFTSLILSLITLILAGVPAALFERASGRQTSDGTSMLIWFISIAIITLPTLAQMLGFI
jgi:hypothetical protein